MNQLNTFRLGAKSAPCILIGGQAADVPNLQSDHPRPMASAVHVSGPLIQRLSPAPQPGYQQVGVIWYEGDDVHSFLAIGWKDKTSTLPTGLFLPAMGSNALIIPSHLRLHALWLSFMPGYIDRQTHELHLTWLQLFDAVEDYLDPIMQAAEQWWIAGPSLGAKALRERGLAGQTHFPSLPLLPLLNAMGEQKRLALHASENFGYDWLNHLLAVGWQIRKSKQQLVDQRLSSALLAMPLWGAWAERQPPPTTLNEVWSFWNTPEAHPTIPSSRRSFRHGDN